MLSEIELSRLAEYFYDQRWHLKEGQAFDARTHRSPEGLTCLHLAAARGDVWALKLLLELGVPLDLRADMGSTALHYATYQGNPEAAKFLVDAGADPDLLDDFGRPAGGPGGD